MNRRIISFNIRYRDDENGHAILERAPRLKCILDREKADLIGMQECTPEWLRYLQRDYGKTYEIFNVWRVGNESTPILIKKDAFEILDKGCFWLSDTPDIPSNGWDTIGCNRICTWAYLKDKQNGRELLFLNTHFGFGDEGQIKSVRLIQAFAQRYKSTPVLLTGDFNMQRTSLAYETATKYFVDANASTVNDESVTFHGYLLKQNQPKLIDYIFIKNCTSKNYRVLDDCFNGKYPSDHFGISSDFEI